MLLGGAVHMAVRGQQGCVWRGVGGRGRGVWGVRGAGGGEGGGRQGGGGAVRMAVKGGRVWGQGWWGPCSLLHGGIYNRVVSTSPTLNQTN